jgi:hypothetical protein
MKPTTDQQRWPSRASNGVALLPRICHTSHADESVTFDEIDDRQNCFFAQSPKAKHRGKGQQKVIVEHVHVYPGGQAIVGQVTPGGGMAGMGLFSRMQAAGTCSFIYRQLRKLVSVHWLRAP